VILPPSGPNAATLVQAQTAAGTLEADRPPSQTNIRDLALAQSADCHQGAIYSHASGNGIVIDKSVVNAMVPSLRIVCGGVTLPSYVGDVNVL
jgi:hypothetical protein